MAEKTGTRQAILEAAVTCIERDGFERVTTRKIALEAGTNIASINYYFRSKDELLSNVLEMTIQHMLEDVMAAIEDQDQPFDDTLRSVFYYLLDGRRRFPGISRAHLQLAVSNQKHGSVSGRAMQRLFERLVQRAARSYPKHDPALIRLRLSQTVGSILFFMLTPSFFKVPASYRPGTSSSARTLADAYTSLFLESIGAR